MKLTAVIIEANNLTGLCKILIENGRQFLLYSKEPRKDFCCGLDPGDVVQIILPDEPSGPVLEYQKAGRICFEEDTDQGEPVRGNKYYELLWRHLATNEMRSKGMDHYRRR